MGNQADGGSQTVRLDRRRVQLRRADVRQRFVSNKQQNTHMTVLERTNQCLLVNDFSPRRVDDDAPPLHPLDLALAHKVDRLYAEGDVHAQYVRLLAQRLEALDVLAPSGRIGNAVPAVVYDAHRKGMHEACEAEADPAESKDAERARGQVVRVTGGNRGFPRPGVQGALRLGEVAEGGEDEVECSGSRGIVHSTRGVGDGDAWRGVSGVDGVEGP